MVEVAHHHCRDGGTDPSLGPTRIPSQCESSIIYYNFYDWSFYVLRILMYVMFVIAAPLPQKWPRATRKESRSVELDKLIHNNDGGLLIWYSIRRVGHGGWLVTIMGNSTIWLISLLGTWYHLTTPVGIKCHHNSSNRLLTYSWYS